VSHVAIGCAKVSELESNVRLAQNTPSVPLETLRALLAEAAASDAIGFDRNVLEVMFP
jgi:hypothetical protein